MARIIENRSRYHEIDINQSLAGNTEVTVDGMILKGIRSIEFEQSYETIPEVTVQLVPSTLNVNILADLNVALDIGDIQEAVNCLQLEMKLNKEFKDAVVASARSALTEHDASKESAVEIAEAVVERIFLEKTNGSSLTDTGNDTAWIYRNSSLHIADKGAEYGEK